MRRIASVVAAGALMAIPAAAQEKVPGGGIVYGEQAGAIVSAPRGWVYDPTAGSGQGLRAVMYPEGSTWKDSTRVMYVNVVRLKEGQAAAAFIADDDARFKKESPDLTIGTGEPIVQAVGGVRAEMRLYTTDATPTYEAVAYASTGSSVAIYVLSCKTKRDFETTLPVFREVVANSYLVKEVPAK